MYELQNQTEKICIYIHIQIRAAACLLCVCGVCGVRRAQLINSSGEVKVTDFGVSSELQNSIAMCGTFVGTFKYMSPERIQSQPYSYASDIWSLGLVLLEVRARRNTHT